MIPGRRTLLKRFLAFCVLFTTGRGRSVTAEPRPLPRPVPRVQTIELGAGTGVHRVAVEGFEGLEISIDPVALGPLRDAILVAGEGGDVTTRDRFAGADLFFQITGPGAIFRNGADPREGIVRDGVPDGFRIEPLSGIIRVSRRAAVDMPGGRYVVWAMNGDGVARSEIGLAVRAP